MYNEGLYFEKYDIKNLQKYEFSGWISRLVTVGVDYGAGDGSDCFEIKVRANHNYWKICTSGVKNLPWHRCLPTSDLETSRSRVSCNLDSSSMPTDSLNDNK